MSCSVWQKPAVFAPSLICFDPCDLQQQVALLKEAGADLLHVDLLDGRFSPSMPLGLDIVRRLRQITDIPFDVHLMTEEQDYFLDELLEIGVQQITFHLECAPHPGHLLDRIQSRGVRAGLALKPATPIACLEYIVEQCDTVLLMLINPGYAGDSSERQVPYAVRKLCDLRQLIDRLQTDTLVEIDGRVSPEDIRQYAGRLADIFVLGSTCMDRSDPVGSLHSLERMRPAGKEKR